MEKLKNLKKKRCPFKWPKSALRFFESDFLKMEISFWKV